MGTTVTSKRGLAMGLCGLAAVAAGGAMAGFAQYEDAPAKQAELGHKAPDFELTDLAGDSHRLSDILAAEDTTAVVLEWYNPQCPFVKVHYKDDTRTTLATQEKFAEDGVVWLRINSGAEGKQGAGLDLNIEHAQKYGIESAILLDESGKVGKKYGAKVTPEMFVLNGDGMIVYHGAIDSDASASSVGDTNYVADAIMAVLAGETVEVAETRARGCSVKY